MLSELYRNARQIKVRPISDKVRVLVSQDAVVDGKLVKQNVYRDSCITDNFKDVSMNDFSLDNLVATGNVSKLRQMSMQNNDYVSVAENVDKVSKSLDESLKTE